MQTNRFQLSHPARALWMAGALVASAGALAASPSYSSEVQARYLQERSVCLSGRSNQDRATCLQEAGAAKAEALRGGLDSSAATTYERNARNRCERLEGADLVACQARMDGRGTTSGSVAAGGIYRELVTREAAVPAGARPTPSYPVTPLKPQ